MVNEILKQLEGFYKDTTMLGNSSTSVWARATKRGGYKKGLLIGLTQHPRGLKFQLTVILKGFKLFTVDFRLASYKNEQELAEAIKNILKTI